MNETDPKEVTYSSEPAATTAIESPAEPVRTESWKIETNGPFAKRTQTKPLAALLETLQSGRLPSSEECKKFLTGTRRVWLVAAAVVIGLISAAELVARATEWAVNRRERRQEQAVATVTPERLMARCGQTVEDVTKDVYPITMRTMSYKPRGQEALVFTFSKTDEVKSDWVFISMKNETRSQSYDTAEEKIAALPCLDSKK